MNVSINELCITKLLSHSPMIGRSQSFIMNRRDVIKNSKFSFFSSSLMFTSIKSFYKSTSFSHFTSTPIKVGETCLSVYTPRISSMIDVETLCHTFISVNFSHCSGEIAGAIYANEQSITTKQCNFNYCSGEICSCIYIYDSFIKTYNTIVENCNIEVNENYSGYSSLFLYVNKGNDNTIISNTSLSFTNDIASNKGNKTSFIYISNGIVSITKLILSTIDLNVTYGLCFVGCSLININQLIVLNSTKNQTNLMTPVFVDEVPQVYVTESVFMIGNEDGVSILLSNSFAFVSKCCFNSDEKKAIASNETNNERIFTNLVLFNITCKVESGMWWKASQTEISLSVKHKATITLIVFFVFYGLVFIGLVFLIFCKIGNDSTPKYGELHSETQSEEEDMSSMT